MTNHADLIAALRITMDVTLPGAPELDEYDEQRKAAADELEAAWAEATAAAWGDATELLAEVGLVGDHESDPIRQMFHDQAPQSARDWLAKREAKIRADERAKVIEDAYTKIIEEARTTLNGVSEYEAETCADIVRTLHTDASRAIPIKEKDNE